MPLVLRLLALAALVVPQGVVLLVQGAAPVLLRDAPLLLLVLHPIEPWSLLVSPRIDVVTFIAVVVAVRMPAYVGDWFVGRWYGAAALTRLSGSGRGRPVAEAVGRVFGRAGGPLLVLFPGATVSVLAGTTGMPLRRFLPLVLSGVLLSAALARVLTELAAGPLAQVVGLTTRYALPLGGALAGVVLLEQVLRARGRRGTPAADPGAVAP